MEVHIINIVRFITCLSALIIAIIAMVKAEDNNAIRRISAVLAGVLIYFNRQIGSIVYLTIGSTIEAFIATTGVGFVLILAIVIMLLPILFIFRWLIH